MTDWAFRGGEELVIRKQRGKKRTHMCTHVHTHSHVHTCTSHLHLLNGTASLLAHIYKSIWGTPGVQAFTDVGYNQ